VTCPRCLRPVPPGLAACPTCGLQGAQGTTLTTAPQVLAPPVAPPRRLAQALVGLLALGAVVDLLGLLTGWRYAAGIQGLLSDPLADASAVSGVERVYALLGGAQLLTSGCTIVLWLVWQYRTYGAVRDLGAPGLLRYSQGWSVGAWFVPFVNLVRPLRMVDDLWTGADPDLPEHGPLTAGPGSRLVPAWWGAFLLGEVLNRITGRLPGETLEDLHTAALLGMANDLAWLVAGGLALVLVHRLSQRVLAQARVRGRLAVR